MLFILFYKICLKKLLALFLYFEVLCCVCQEIKLSTLKMKPGEEAASDEQEMAAIVVATAKKLIITQVNIIYITSADCVVTGLHICCVFSSPEHEVLSELL